MNNAKLYLCHDYSFNADSFLTSLPKDRAEKALKLKIEKDKKNCVGAYLLLKYALKKENIENFEFIIGQNGKPYLKDNPLFFSLSHTSSGFICAVSDKEIGADIQVLKTPSESLLERVCSEKELVKIKNSSDLSAEFTRIWTLKESAIKKNAGILADYGKYEFFEDKTDFYKYNSHFVSFKSSNAIISLCGEFENTEIFDLNFCEIV